MANTARRAVNAVTDFVFPVPKPARDQQEHYLLRTRSQEYVSSLPLQMAMYFNMFYYPLWLITEIVMLAAKFSILDTVYQVVVIAILVFMTIVEVIRTYIGYLGNLMEKVPELAGYWLLTILLQSPLVLFLLLADVVVIVFVILTTTTIYITPIEYAVTIVLTLFILFEDIAGYFAIRNMVDSQVNKFHLQQFTGIEQIPDPYINEYETSVRHR